MRDSRIEWTHHTFNPWIGCTKVSPACRACYAEAMAKRYGWVEWGAGKPRKRTSANNWRQPVRWDREARAAGTRKRVFCASLADVFDAEVPTEWRDDLWSLIRVTTNLDWLLLTKRPENIKAMLPADWGQGWPNVWLGVTAENQEMADLRLPVLLQVPAVVRFASVEPMLDAMDLCPYLVQGLHWVIVGGETGKGAHRVHPEHARGLRDQCVNTGVAFHFKQWGDLNADGLRVGKKKAGRVLDGRTWGELPVPVVNVGTTTAATAIPPTAPGTLPLATPHAQVTTPKRKLAAEARAKILAGLRSGKLSAEVAAEAGVSKGSVAAVKAHKTRGSYA